MRSTEDAQEARAEERATLGPPWSSENEFEELFGKEIPKIGVRETWGDVRAGFYSAIDLLLYDPRNERSSGLRFTDLRPTTELRVGNFAARLELDLIGVDTRNNVYEAWGGVDIDSWLRLRAGQMRFSMGSEGATHESELPFVGYSFVPHLSTRYDVGLRADGELADGLWLSAWGTLGYGFGLEGQKLSSPQLGIRGTVQPFELFGVGPDDGASFLRGVFFGLGFSQLLDGDDPLVAVSPLQSVMLVTPKLDGRGGSWRNIEVGYALGPLQVMFEDSMGSYDDVPIAGGRTNMDQLSSMAWTVALNLSGEARGWRHGAWDSRIGTERTELFSFLPDGLWTLALRHSNGDFDRTLFDEGYATYDPSTQEVRTFSLALFWSPSNRVRFGAQWTKIIADNELTTLGGTSRDDSFALRLEFRF
ncbi:MAG: hypothetical protein JNM84_04555 [Planctomycetes bacterium]|nr:hypothetical protein [Planctomycetota bacterium]